VQEISGMEGNVITMQEIFSFQQKGLDANGNVRGTFRFQGIRPKFIEKFKMVGIHLPQEIFDPNHVVEV
jgi:pilus assembly protein CpaF